ncbi:hypothetical protein CL634_05565 [bacterium]|nr:hypothetical protein [bacterium]|tara:strand:+ start:65 stop:343 length:279 start_codon:yes stop_codon:yes gene_type:complete
MAKNRLQDTLEARRLKSEEKRAKEKDREDKLESRRNYRLEKIKEVTAKAYAVATKRKWLVFLIGIALVAYFVISSGGFGGLSGIVDKVKSFF